MLAVSSDIQLLLFIMSFLAQCDQPGLLGMRRGTHQVLFRKQRMSLYSKRKEIRGELLGAGLMSRPQHPSSRTTSPRVGDLCGLDEGPASPQRTELGCTGKA